MFTKDNQVNLEIFIKIDLKLTCRWIIKQIMKFNKNNKLFCNSRVNKLVETINKFKNYLKIQIIINEFKIPYNSRFLINKFLKNKF
jgi:hypothetical protein